MSTPQLSEQERRIVDAVLYAIRVGCFFPVPVPTRPYRVGDLVKWGAMHNLHAAIAKLPRIRHEPSPK